MEPWITRWNEKLRNPRLLCILIFVTALAFRVVDFNSISITYDELAAKDSGPWWQLVKSGNFTSEGWGYHKPTVAIIRWLYGVIPQALFGDDPGSAHDLAGARFNAAVLGSLQVMVVFLIGRQLGGSGVGVMASFFLSLFPGVLGHDRFASHDLPARLASTVALWMMTRYFQTGRRRDWFFAILWAGISFAAYMRVGMQTILILQAALVVHWFVRRREAPPEMIPRLISFGLLSGIVGLVIFTITWPYLWSHPIQGLLEVFGQQGSVAKAGGSMEWFFGTIRTVPIYYYVVIFVATMPLAVFLAFMAGLYRTAKGAIGGNESLLLWLFAFAPLIAGAISFRSALNHYILICYPSTCVLAALGIVSLSEKLARWKMSAARWRCAIGGFVVASELLTVVRIHPYYIDFFSAIVGGTRSVVKNHTFNVGWYGEGIQPLFDYVNRNAPPGSTVTCRLAAWPGLADLPAYLRNDLRIQGHTAIHPLGADYVLRVGLETGSEFYRHCPDPGLYEKVMDVNAMGGSIGDVWQRRADAAAGGLLYSDDFSSPQSMGFLKGGQNANLNPFSNGKLYSIQPGQPSVILLQLPAALFQKWKTLSIDADVQMREAQFRIRGGNDPKKLRELASVAKMQGLVHGTELEITPGKDVYISLEWMTAHRWDGSPRSFWEADWVDSLQISGKTK